MDIREEDILGEDVGRHWYYRAKAAFLHRALDGDVFRRLLDVGAGSGFFSRWLLTHTDVGEAVCVDPGYTEEREEQFGGKHLALRKSCPKVEADLVLMMDVLEHVDDDIGFLKQYLAAVPAGATFVITVPALPWLWSDHDVALGHRRRYTRDSLRAAVAAAGLEIERLHYLFGLVLPFAAVVRLAERLLPGRKAPESGLKKHSALVNALLFLLCAMERPLARFNRLAGLSLLCRCKRTAH